MGSSEKRRIQRHILDEHIRLEGGRDVIDGRTVDVSRDGMKVLVDSKHDFDRNSRLLVNFPGTGGDGIPCRIRRTTQGEDHWEIGLEFEGENDARMLLVERWLETLENRTGTTDSAPTESRQIPRTRCTLKDIRCTDGSINVLSVEDISLDGMLIRVRKPPAEDQVIPLALRLDGTDREISFSGRVAYVADDGKSVGLSISEMKETDRNRLRQFIVDIASGVAMLEYHKLLENEIPGSEFRVERNEARELIDEVISSRTTVNMLDESGLRIFETHLSAADHGLFKADVADSEDSGVSGFFSFSVDGSSYTFSTKRTGRDPQGKGLYAIPELIYRGEKRTGRRRAESQNPSAILVLAGTHLNATVLESSRRGLLCEMDAGDLEDPEKLVTGSPVDLIREKSLTLACEIRHVDRRTGILGNAIYRIGLETGIRRKEPKRTTYSESEWESAWKGEQRALGRNELIRPRIVDYEDGRGRGIRALLHILRTDRPCTAVIIPPAFGKKKEVLAPLALTLMTHFAEAGENVAVVRYDGIDRPGESDNSNRHARRGYEMLGYRIDQGYVDLAATMHWVKTNRIFTPEKTVIVSFSMSALDARRLQSDPLADSADYWISVMGVSSSQGALRNILGGLDVIGNHRMGMPIGTMGMLGQLIDMDRMASEMVRLGYASASDAREAMGRIGTPVTWIYGAHDRWMVPEEILDVMSIWSEGERELIEVPTAHNLRTSDDALSVFQIISDAVLRRIKGIRQPSVSPEKGELLDLITRERERITEGENLDAGRYWKGYLIGESEEDEGYDFYGKLREFREFVELEAELLDPRPGESIADMGCGTGLVSRALLRRLGRTDSRLKGTRFTAVDLVGEALEKVQSKYRELSGRYRNLRNIKAEWIAMNLEPDPLVAIRRCVSTNGPVSVGDIRDRVRGLNSDTADRLEELPTPVITAILSGEPLGPDYFYRFERILRPADILTCEDLNRAARFVKGNLDETDLKVSRRIGSGAVSAERLSELRTSDLQLGILDLDDWPRDANLGIPDGVYDSICASLFLSYLFAPGEAVREFHRMLRPGGRLLISSMKPDSDISGIFTAYIAEQSETGAPEIRQSDRERNLREARTMLNEAASLFSLEEDGWFRFFSSGEMIQMMRNAGFTDITIYESLGKPSQAIIATGIKKTVDQTGREA